MYLSRPPRTDIPRTILYLLVFGTLVPAALAQTDNKEFGIVVTAAQGAIKSGPNVLSIVPRGAKLWVFAEQGGFYKVKVPKREQRGWIHNSQVAKQELSADKKLQGQGLLRSIDAAMKLVDQKQYAEAVNSYRTAIAIAVDVFGPQHFDTADLRKSLAASLYFSGNLTESIAEFRESLSVFRRVRGSTDPKTIEVAEFTATALMEGEQYQEAIPLFREVAQFSERRHMIGAAASAYYDLGYLLHMEYQSDEAKRSLQRSIELYRKLPGDQDANLAESLVQLGLILYDNNETHEALPHFREARDLFLKLNDEAAVGRLDALIGSSLRYSGEPDKAERILVSAAETLRRVHTEAHEHTQFATAELGYLLSELGRGRESRAWFEESLSLARTLYGDDDDDVLDLLTQLSRVFSIAGDYPRALKFRNEVLELSQRKFAKDNLKIGFAHHDVAVSLLSIGDTKQAESHFAAAIRIFENQSPTATESIGLAQLDLSDIYTQTKNFAKAAETIETALTHLRNRPDYEVEVADALAALSFVLGRQGNHELAVGHAREALRIYQRVLGENHADVTLKKQALSIALFEKGDIEESLQLYRDVVREQEASDSNEDANLTVSYSNLAEAFVKLNHSREAARALEKSRRASRRHLARVLPALTPEEQIRFLKLSDEELLWISLSFALRDAGQSRVPEMSAGWLLNGKAVAQEALAESALFAKQENADVVKRLRIVRSQLSQLSLQSRARTERTNKAEAEKLQQRIAALETEQQSLVRKLGSAGSNLADDPWISIGRLRDDLPYETAFVNISRIRLYDFDSDVATPEDRWRVAHYLAWLIPASGEGPVRILDLGNADRIDKRVAEVRRQIEDSAKLISLVGELEATEQLREPLKQLSKSIVDPLLPYLTDVKKLIVSPDGSLWLAPWSALPANDTEFLIEKFDIGYAVSGRELIRQNRRRSSNAAVIMADPDYDLASGSASGLPPSSKLPRVERLPGTATEARSVTPALTSYLDAEPEVLMRAAATESKFKQLFRPQLLMISTHGFFLQDQQTSHNESNPTRSATFGRRARTPSSVAMTNPLLRCGLLLAGCNTGGSAKPDDTEDDGVLTGLEIIGTDLRGTELVVLSACETGVGEVRNGEGVAGLRQAFQLAGAKSVLATLWKIPDKETARLISKFFGNLAADQTGSDALRNAQLARIQARRERNGAAHPFFWSAFTFTGSN